MAEAGVGSAPIVDWYDATDDLDPTLIHLALSLAPLALSSWLRVTLARGPMVCRRKKGLFAYEGAVWSDYEAVGHGEERSPPSVVYTKRDAKTLNLRAVDEDYDL